MSDGTSSTTLMLGEEDFVQKKGGPCRCSLKVKAEFVNRNEMLSGEYKTPVRARMKVGAGGQTLMVEEWVDWSIE